MHYPVQFAQIDQEITQIILTSPDSQTLLVRIARALGERFQVDYCLILAVDDPAVPTSMALWCADHYSPLFPGYQGQLWQHPLLNTGFSEQKPLAISDIESSEYLSGGGNCPQILPVRALLRIHTQFQSAVNGAIILGRSQPHDWTSWEKELLSTVAQSVAIAFSQVHLTRQVLVATRHQTLLNQLSRAMCSGLSLNEIFQIAIAGTAQALQVTQGLLLLLKDNDPPLTPQLSNHLLSTQVSVASEWLEEHSTPMSALLNQSFWVSESALCQQALKKAPEPIAIADRRTTSTVDLTTPNLSILEQVSLPAVLIVPLLKPPNHQPLATRVLGFLVFQHRQPRPWYPDELQLVTWVSTQLSATLIHHQTLQHVQSLVEDRTAQLQQSLEVQAKLYEKTRQQVEQLQELNQLKEDFISTMNHELRTPLTAMSLAIRMLRQPKLPAKRREKYLEILEEQCNQEIELINDLLSLQQLESNPSQIQAQTINLMALIEQLGKSFEQKWATKGLTLEVESAARSLMMNTDVDSLNRILLELLTNAGKYSNPNTTVSLKISREVKQSIHQITVTLTNISSGLSPQELNHIFEKFRRGQGVTQQAVQGTGLGLALVKCLVQHLNGTIEVSSSPLENSQSAAISFTVSLPQFHKL